jgi:hypothetical protein
METAKGDAGGNKSGLLFVGRGTRQAAKEFATNLGVGEWAINANAERRRGIGAAKKFADLSDRTEGKT